MRVPSVASVNRAFEILEHFRAVRRPLALKDLVRELGHPTSSTADLLKSLSHLGYLTFDTRTRTYFPTPRLGALGDWVADDILVRSYPIDALARLRERTEETVLLGTPNDLEVLYLVVLESPHSARYVSRGYMHRPLVRSGVGWALLSGESDDDIERVWRRSIARGLVNRRGLPLKDLIEGVGALRRRGHVVARDALNPGAAVVAMPVPASYYGRPLAIGIGGVVARIEPKSGAVAAALMEEIERLGPDAARAVRVDAASPARRQGAAAFPDSAAIR